MSIAEGKTITDDLGTLHYHEDGEGTPLILLHGSGPGVSGWANFSENLPVFAKHYRTIILDLPGYGGTSPSPLDPVSSGVEAVVRLMDALDIKSAHILGNSFGGIIGAHLAARHPERVLRYVTIGGIGVSLLTPFPNEGINRLVDFAQEPTRERLIAWLHTMVYDRKIVTEAMIETRLKAALEPVTLETSRRMYSREAMDAMSAIFEGPNGVSRFAYLSQIQAPTLITWGREDRVSNVDGALIPMRMIPNCQLHVFPRCGHWAMIEQKAAFEDLVLSFLRQS